MEMNMNLPGLIPDEDDEETSEVPAFREADFKVEPSSNIPTIIITPQMRVLPKMKMSLSMPTMKSTLI